MSTTETLGQVVGGNVRRLRTEQGATLEDLGRAVRSLGFNWSTSRVNAIERGAREPKIGTLAVLAVALSCSVRELAQTDADFVDIGDVLIEGEHLPTMFAITGGAPILYPSPDRILSDSEWVASRGWPSAESLLADVQASIEPWWPGYVVRDQFDLTMLRRIEGMSGLVEERTAKMLDLDPVLLAAWSLAMWDRPLSEERDRLAVGDVRPADVTEELRDELREHVATLTDRQRQPTQYED